LSAAKPQKRKTTAIASAGRQSGGSGTNLLEKNIALIFRRAYTAASPTASPIIDDNLIPQQGGDI